MILDGLIVDAADGLHDDGWCLPLVKLRLTATGDGTELRVGVWIKPEDDGRDRAVFTLMSDKAAAQVKVVPFDALMEIQMPIKVSAGEAFDVRISTSHRASKGDDVRDLSFIISSLSMA